MRHKPINRCKIYLQAPDSQEISVLQTVLALAMFILALALLCSSV